MARTLLLNWVYYNPVGHVVEGLKIARGYRAANPGIEVHLMVNAAAPVELAERAPWVSAAFAIDPEEVTARGRRARCLRGVPERWDWIVYDDRAEKRPEGHHDWLVDYHAWCTRNLRATRWQGGAEQRFVRDPPPEQPAYSFDEPIEIRPPADAARWAGRFRHDGPLVAILPCGSWPAPWFPTVDAWDRIVGAVFDAFPGVRVVVTGTSARRAGRTTSTAFGPMELDTLLGRRPRLEHAWDVGLWRQVALLRRASVLVAPHTGFGFLAPAVGTPWLTVSGATGRSSSSTACPSTRSCPTAPCIPATPGGSCPAASRARAGASGWPAWTTPAPSRPAWSGDSGSSSIRPSRTRRPSLITGARSSEAPGTPATSSPTTGRSTTRAAARRGSPSAFGARSPRASSVPGP